MLLLKMSRELGLSMKLSREWMELLTLVCHFFGCDRAAGGMLMHWCCDSLASPFHFNVTDPYKDLINPAVNGESSFKSELVNNFGLSSRSFPPTC